MQEEYSKGCIEHTGAVLPGRGVYYCQHVLHNFQSTTQESAESEKTFGTDYSHEHGSKEAPGDFKPTSGRQPRKLRQ